MSKRVLILSSSPRRNGNSNVLCKQFQQGALDAGHAVETLFLADYHIAYCLGCGKCMERKDGTCVQQDDMADILDKMEEADVIVFATPVYFYNMCAQMKTLLDRTCPRYQAFSGKEFYLILTAAETDREIMETAIQSFQGYFNCIEAPIQKEVLFGLGVYETHEIESLPIMQEAYDLGRQC